MAYVSDPTDPAAMTPDARIAEVAAILAEGFLRLHRRAAAGFGTAEVASNTVITEPTCLDECVETSPHGHRG